MFYKIGLIYIPFNDNVDKFLNSIDLNAPSAIIGIGKDSEYYTKKLHICCFIIFRCPIKQFIDVYKNEYNDKINYRFAPHLQTINVFATHIYSLYKTRQPYFYYHKNIKYNIFVNQIELLSGGYAGKTFLLNDANSGQIVHFLNTQFGTGFHNAPISEHHRECNNVLNNAVPEVLTSASIQMINDMYKQDFIIFRRLKKSKKQYVRLASL